MSPTKLEILAFVIVVVVQLQISEGVEVEGDLYSPSERAAIEKLHSKVRNILVTEEHHTDDFLIRWLQARDMNINNAAEMLHEFIKWRRYNRIDSILNETILEFKINPYEIEGHDKKGYPLMFFTPTIVDLRKLLIQGSRQKVIRYWFQMIERGNEACIKVSPMTNGHNRTRVTSILDLHGYNLKQHFCNDCIGVYKEWFIGLEKFYPETLEHFIVVNVPRIANPLIEIVRPLLSKSADRALKTFVPDRKEWSEFLLSIISPDQLPYRFGGTKKSKPAE